VSIQAINWALNEVSGISATQKCILLTIADRADSNGYCYPSYEDICVRSCANRKTVATAIKALNEAGLLKKIKRFNKSTIYCLAISPDFGLIKSGVSSTDIGTGGSTDIGTFSSTDIGTLTIIEPPKEPSWRSRFDEFWFNYPKKVGKPKAEQSFKNLTVKDQKALLGALGGYQFSTDKQYIPFPATFINQRRWEDEQETKTRSSGGFEI
jgi:hypothetical protein